MVDLDPERVPEIDVPLEDIQQGGVEITQAKLTTFGFSDWDDLVGRDRGILTQTDREYLLGEKEYAHEQSETNKRNDIVRRIHESIRDFLFLAHFTPREIMQKTLDQAGESEDLNTEIEAMVRFGYMIGQFDTTAFEEILARAIESVEATDEWSQTDRRPESVDVSIDIEYEPDESEILARFERGERLLDRELGLLVRKGLVTSADLEDRFSEYTDYHSSRQTD